MPSDAVPEGTRRLSSDNLRALAHPLRYRMLQLLGRDGPSTASALGRLVGESSGTTSYHLRLLADAGFIEEDPARGTGRDRYWRSAGGWTLGSELFDDPVSRATAAVVVEQALAVRVERLRRWNERRHEWPVAWRRAGLVAERRMALTSEEAGELARELHELAERYEALHDRDDPPSGTADVMVHTDVIPDGRRPEGAA